MFQQIHITLDYELEYQNDHSLWHTQYTEDGFYIMQNLVWIPYLEFVSLNILNFNMVLIIK